MNLGVYVDNLRRELSVAAEVGGEDARALAERLTTPLESAIRLTLLDALSSAVDEITRDLAPGSVDLRLRGGEPEFVVTAPPTDQAFEAEGGQSAPAEVRLALEADEGAMSRINVRMPERLKVRVEEAAAREGLSVNAWLVRAAAAAVEPAERPAGHSAGRRGQRYTGWAR
ncbi:toxin-antitoxin system HicB family antitoxin [Saccharopolyspora spinosa]|uniref:HicB-like protein involved in pilus formation n=1 Tax=Saccharopolyspora spinosa TaxID=60894 RepID=A0A2N3XVA7_SACSN|nr:toxin-antitoxin system HicB family antitoxin [Saccharopolyspora spinosa]PKW14613.1 HicB-like protein involved in pilus formation [Saccharopolyspora spinosa]